MDKGPSQKYLEANEVKYFSLGGEGVGDFMVTISHFQGEGVKGEVKNISLHWLQGIFETVPNCGAD